MTRSGSLVGAKAGPLGRGLASSRCHQATVDPGGSSRVVGSAQGALWGASGAGGWSQRSSWLRAAAMATGAVRPSWATTSHVSPGGLAAQYASDRSRPATDVIGWTATGVSWPTA